ncbi:MAG: DUF4249 family protein, partial [Bacteroidota bacterium]
LISHALSSCIEELENPSPEFTQLFINGQLSNSDGLREITVSNINSFTGEGSPLEASGKIFRDGQDPLDLEVLSTGTLRPPQGYMFEAGREYFVEISLADGRVITSEPQIILPPLKTDSISFAVREDRNDERRPGEPIVFRKIEFFAHIDLADLSERQQYFRWVIDEAWLMIGLGQGNICYVEESIRENPYQVASNTTPGAKVGEVKISVLDNPLDFSFEHEHYINVYTHSLDASSYDFYAKNLRLTDINGSLYDEIPGQIEGNLRNVDDPEEKVTGWVEFFLADTLRLKVFGRDINALVPQQCDIAPGATPPLRCTSCVNVYGIETRDPPFYWER